MAEVVDKKKERKIPRFSMAGICKSFGATRALDEVSFEVCAGEVHALVGENGAGKSTLMKILSGAIEADKGEMFIDGADFHPQNPLDARRSGIGMIYQELSLALHLTVEENIFLGVEPLKSGLLNRAEIRRRSQEAIAIFEHPEIKPDTLTSALSVGARQLVEIGRALAAGVKILIFDEPTSSLSQHDAEHLFTLIERLKKQDIAIVYISHFLEEINRIADRITILRDGKSISTNKVSDVNEDDIIRMMVGRDVDDIYPRSVREKGDLLLKVEDLHGKSIPDSASIELYRGEILGIFGLVGAGRTEFLRILFGLDAIKSGQIKIKSYSGYALPEKRWKQGAGYVSENRKEEGLALEMNIADNITLTKYDDLGPFGLILKKNQFAAVENMISYFDIRTSGPGQPIKDLSGGNQQKAALARLLYHNVDILLLDEPTRGIDVGSKTKIYQILDQLVAGDNPKGIILISSYLPELLGICDRIAVMSQGKLSQAMDITETDENKIMQLAIG